MFFWGSQEILPTRIRTHLHWYLTRRVRISVKTFLYSSPCQNTDSKKVGTNKKICKVKTVREGRHSLVPIGKFSDQAGNSRGLTPIIVREGTDRKVGCFLAWGRRLGKNCCAQNRTDSKGVSGPIFHARIDVCYTVWCRALPVV